MKSIKVGKWSFTQSDNSHGYHLYKDKEVQNKETGKTTIEPKLIGYDMPLKSIAIIIAEDEAFECSETILGLLQRIEIKLSHVELSIKEQLIKER